MKTYLSIDLDYFNGRDESLVTFFDKVLRQYITPKIVRYHHELLPHIDASGCTKLINIDFHSDLCESCYELNEGTWVNYVRWRTKGLYEWRYPVKEPDESNYCHALINPFTTESEWKEVKLKQGLAISRRGIREIGVCLSPDWVQRRPVLYHLMGRLNMPLEWLE